ncbi:MAG: hypothetical protein ACR2GU_12755 [Rubrobacteraceae bacterium]
MPSPDSPGSGLPDIPERPLLSPGERGRITRAAALRPINVLMLILGGGIFAVGVLATPLAWLILLLTLVTYTALVILSARDPVFQQRTLEGRSSRAIETTPQQDRDISPERRARWLPRGETRQNVEDALVTYRKAVTAIEESDDVTRAVLDDAVPKLHAASRRLVEVADRREKAAEMVKDLENREPNEEQKATLTELESEIRAADVEISATSEQFLTLRARVVRASIDSSNAAMTATELNTSLDELNLRIEALGETMNSPNDPPPHRGGLTKERRMKERTRNPAKPEKSVRGQGGFRIEIKGGYAFGPDLKSFGLLEQGGGQAELACQPCPMPFSSLASAGTVWG